MQKNRLLSILLIVMMLLGLLSGCGKEAENTPVQSDAAVQDASAQEAAEEPAAQDDPETTAPSPESDTEENIEILPDDTVESYENEEFGFGFAPSDWTFYEDEVLQAQTDANYVMAAVNSAGETVSVAIQDTLPEHQGLSEDELYFLLLMTEQPKLQELGLPDTGIEVSTTEFLGKECAALHSRLGAAGVEQKQLYLVQDEHTCVITVTSANEEAIDIIMGLFHQA